MKSRHLLQRILTLAVILLAMLVCNTACVDSVNNEYQLTDKGVKLIPYTVTAQGPVESKATLKGKKNMIFQPGDKLIITSEDETVEGELDLKSGGGSNSGTFEGILEYHGTEPGPSGDLMLYARLVGLDDQIGTGTFVGGITGEMYEAVEQYSTLTGESTYSAKSFALSQGTTFIEFALTIEPTPVDGSYEVVVYNNETDALVSANVDVEDGETEFVVALPGGTTLNHARVTLCGCEIKFGKSSATVLSPSKTYSVAKTGYNYDDLGTPLTLEAAEEGTIVIHNHSNLPITYTLNGISQGEHTEDPIRIEVVEGDKVSMFGDGNTTSYCPGVFSSGQFSTYIVPTGDCYLYGNIMSLIDPVNFATATRLEGDDAFAGLFCNCDDLISSSSNIPISSNGHIRSHARRNIVLPATELTEGCYMFLFDGTQLVRAPELPATIAPTRCYAAMFVGTRLKKAPNLPAETVGDHSYSAMFTSCVSLTSVPSSLPATTLVEGCYGHMFYGCSSLTTIPAGFLPAETIAKLCYEHMFENCTSLATVPADLLPAKSLYSECYHSMFKGCTSLETAPDLPAETPVYYCYDNMFEGCTSLNYIKCLATSNSVNYMRDWVKDVAPSGTFHRAVGSTWPIGNNGIPENWIPITDIDNALTFEATASGNINLFGFGASTTIDCYKNEELTTLTSNTSISVVAGDIVRLVGDNLTLSGLKISSTGNCMVSGNIMSLLSSTDFETMTEIPAGASFRQMFKDATKITNNPAKPLLLPATTLQESCYEEMFYNSGLTTAPDLPATTLTKACYKNMFYDCYLTVAPELPATTLAESCYEGMFYLYDSWPSKLTTAPALPATVMAKSCYKQMFSGNRSLTAAPELPATTLAESCYQEMFSSCLSLTNAPELPATTLAESCYQGMFASCTSLATAPDLPATILAKSCYQQMFNYCSGLTTAPEELPAPTLAEACYQEMFYSCTSLATAPALPATTLADWCYAQMFMFCSNLTTPPALPATNLTLACYGAMFYYCTRLASAPVLPATSLAMYCYTSMFSETALTTAPDLPATVLADYCYAAMFENCRNLSSVKCLATDISAEDCVTDWLKNVASSGTFTKAKDMTTWTPDSVSGIPTGWTVQDAE